jgi:hypothetical protein
MVDSEESEGESGTAASVASKQKYSKATRDLSDKAKKQRIEKKPAVDSAALKEMVDSDEEFVYEDDDEFYQKLIDSKENAEQESAEDLLKMQLKFEQEEAERKLKQEQEQPKTKIDEDGTEYEWDSAVKGWFPKVSHLKAVCCVALDFKLNFFNHS